MYVAYVCMYHSHTGTIAFLTTLESLLRKIRIALVEHCEKCYTARKNSTFSNINGVSISSKKASFGGFINEFCELCTEML